MQKIIARWGGAPNVKIRDGILDVKTLRQVDAAELEQRFPIMKAPFPLAATDVARVYAALRVDPPAPARAPFALDEFRGAVAAAVSELGLGGYARGGHPGGCLHRPGVPREARPGSADRERPRPAPRLAYGTLRRLSRLKSSGGRRPDDLECQYPHPPD